MPSTYNGVGTHYYGKKNLQTRAAECPHCGHRVTLSSYDTRLWFVVFFIPVIPIGRKRIIDDCSVCRRHYAMDLHKWETTKQLETSGALEKFRSDPTPENAIDAHRQLVLYHQTGEAADLQKTLQEKFSDNAKVQVYLAGALVHLGRLDEAKPFYARALELRPDLPEARIGVAEDHIRGNRLEEARALLDFLEKPGAAQLYSLEPLEKLALAYQRANQHNAALEIFRKLMEALPNLAQHKGFRAMVQRSETSKENSILPKKKFSWREFFQGTPRTSPTVRGPVLTWKSAAVIGAIALVVAVGMIIGNNHTRTHRKVQFVNMLAQNAEADISGIGKVKVPRGFSDLTLPEGKYHLKISGPVQEQMDIDISSGYFSRWFDHPVWVVNVGSAAVFVVEHIVYAVNPVPGSVSVVYGQSFYNFGDVEYPFTTPPQTMSVKSTEQRHVTHLDLYRGKPIDLFGYFLKGNRAEAFRFAEWELRRHPENEELLGAYSRNVQAEADLVRVKKFLQAGLTNRPVQIEWHRTYQNMYLGHSGVEELIPQYDAFLKSDPENSALLYLRGRICGDHVLGAQYFERSHKADEKNPYPIFGSAFDRMAVGDWENAKVLLERVLQLRPDDSQFFREWECACVALGRFDEAGRILQAKLLKEPTDIYAGLELCDVLLAAGRTTDAEKVRMDLEQAWLKKFPRSAGEVSQAVRRNYYYSSGNFSDLEKMARAERVKGANTSLFYALVEQSRLDEATKIYPLNDLKSDDPFHFLAVSVAWRLANNREQADRWQARAVQLLRQGGSDSARAADLLEGKTEPTSAALDNVIFALPAKALLIADLAVLHPDKKAELSAAARRLNVERNYPYHLIQRATAL